MPALSSYPLRALTTVLGHDASNNVGRLGTLALANATVTANTPILDLAQTWNNAAVVFTGLKYNSVPTACDNNSLLLDIQQSGTSVMTIGTFGFISLNGSRGAAPTIQFNAPSGSGPGFQFQIVGLGNSSMTVNLDSADLPRIGMGAGATSRDLFLYRVSPGVLELRKTTGGAHNAWLNYGGQARVTSDFSVTSSTTLVDVTGLTATLTAGRTYSFEAKLFVTDAAAGGVQAAISGTATATNIQYTGFTVADNAIKGLTNATALGTAVASTLTTITVGIMVQIYGTITVNAAGTLTVQMAQNTSNGTATVAKQGSYLHVQDIA